MAAFNFPNSPNTNDTHTENGVTWKWNGSVWKRVESVGAQGAQGKQGATGAGSDGAQGSTGAQGHQGKQGATGSTSSNAGTVTIRTDNGNAYHQLVFVDSTTDNQAQILKMDDEYSRLMWNPNNETLVIYRAQPYQIKTWSGSYGTSGQVLTSGGSGAAWSWQDLSSGVTDVAVSYTGRSAPCTLPITITGTTTKTINIPDSSNAFGAKYVQNTEPTGSSVCAGDVWYDTSSQGGGSTDALQIAKGTTAQRPGSPADGMIRYNTSTDVIEEYRSSNWHVLSHKSVVSSTNSTITTADGYTIHTFATSGTFTISDQSLKVDYLVVAGGGGGGQKRAGGGGAGGMITASNVSLAAGTYTITVGAGGNGGTGTSSWTQGGDGSNSIISSIVTATGGGGGAREQAVGSDGGSGGGGSDGQNGGSGTSGQGNDGGNSSSSSGGGGGGGKGGVGNGGGNAAAGSSGYDGGDGGTGGSSSITGTSVTYAGGGGGGARHGDATGGAGAAGGGNGGKDCSNMGTAATVNTGSGGGGGGRDSDSDAATCFDGGNGGSGIVIVRYITTDAEYRY